MTDGTSNHEIITTSPSPRRRPSISLSSFPRFKALILACISVSSLLLLLVAFGSTDIDASNLRALHADLSEKLATKWRQATATSTSSSSTTVQGLDRSWDFYAQNGIFVNARTNNSIPQNRKARFIPVDFIDQLAEEGKTGLEGDLKLGDGFDEISRYGQGALILS